MDPRSETVEVWRIDLRREDPSDVSILSPAELARVDRLLFETKRRQLRVGRAAMRRVLGMHLGITPAEVLLVEGDHGKPELPHAPWLGFNLSHSADLALLAVGHFRQIGVDLEAAREGRAFSAIASRFFSAQEYLAWSALPEPERVSAFYRIWACKEAYLKAWGTGLTVSSQRFTIAFAGHDRAEVGHTEMPGDADPSSWRLRILDAGPGYVGALCCSGPEPKVEVCDVPR